MRKEDVEDTVRELVERYRGRIVDLIRTSFPSLEPHEETVVAVIRALGNIANATASGHEPAVAGTLQAGFDTLASLLATHQEIAYRLEGDLIETGARRDQAVTDLAKAREETARTIRERDLELERSREQLARVETLVLGGGDRVISSLREFSVGLVAKLDTLLASGQELLGVAHKITSDAGRELPDIANRISGLDNRTGALSHQAAPLLAHEMDLTAEDLETLERVLQDLGVIANDYEGLCSLVTELSDLRAATEVRFVKWSDEWLELRQLLAAAETLFPHIIGQGLFSFASTSAETVMRKRKILGDMALEIKRAVTAAARVVNARESEFTESLGKIRVRRDELERLRGLIAQPWLDELEPKDRELAHFITLAFRTPNEVVTLPKLKQLIADAYGETIACTDDDLSRLIGLPLFESSGAPIFKKYRLTARGRYWLMRWKKEKIEIEERVNRGYDRLAVREEDKEREETVKRAATEADARAREARREADAEERARAAAEREATRNDPVLIRSKLGQLEKEVLQALSLLPELPAARDSVAWSRVLAAAHCAGLITTREKPSLLAVALVKLILFDPPLFEGRRNDQTVKIVFSETGQAVYRLLFTPRPERIATFEEMMGKDVRLWDKEELDYRKLLERACINDMRRVPIDRYKP